MIALIQLKGLLQRRVSPGVLTEHFLKARRPVNNQARGDPALSTQEMPAVSTVWHCAVTTYHSWAPSQLSAVWKHHSPYLFLLQHDAALAIENTQRSQPTKQTTIFISVLFACSIWHFELFKQSSELVYISPSTDIVQLSNLSPCISINPLQIYNKIWTFNTAISLSWIKTLFWRRLSHYSCRYPQEL